MAIQSKLALDCGDLLLEVLDNATGNLRVILLRAEASTLAFGGYALPTGRQTSIALSDGQVHNSQHKQTETCLDLAPSAARTAEHASLALRHDGSTSTIPCQVPLTPRFNLAPHLLLHKPTLAKKIQAAIFNLLLTSAV
jgi:hypothetical protein